VRTGMQADIKGYLEDLEGPVLIISNRVGLGHQRIALAIQERIDPDVSVTHLQIEDLLEQPAQKAGFSLFYCLRGLLYRFPVILNFLGYFPLRSWLQFCQEQQSRKMNLELLRSKIEALKVKTVITASQRASFLVSILKQRGELDPVFYICLTHYHIGPAWKYMFWNTVDKFFVPAKDLEVPFLEKEKCIEVVLPVSEQYHELANVSSDYNTILITGGGWGLGGLEAIVDEITAPYPELKLHVVCGDNDKLYRNLSQKYDDFPNLYLYSTEESLVPLMKKCGVVVCRPGAVSVTECMLADKKVFLIQCRQVEPKANAEYGIRNFGMQYYSPASFSKWYDETRSD
jgi:UDP-N-acetylglucosamine:LPS N-acetylglucosamine transferase